VREAAVVGVPDWYRGETVKAVVSLKPRAHRDPGRVEGLRARPLAAFKAPRLVEIVDELPKTASGKILRRLLVPGRRPRGTTGGPASHIPPAGGQLIEAGRGIDEPYTRRHAQLSRDRRREDERSSPAEPSAPPARALPSPPTTERTETMEYLKVATELGDRYVSAVADTQKQFLKYMKLMADSVSGSGPPAAGPPAVTERDAHSELRVRGEAAEKPTRPSPSGSSQPNPRA
jgi:hypothetical protein